MGYIEETAKEAAFTAADALLPGSGTIAREIGPILSVLSGLGGLFSSDSWEDKIVSAMRKAVGKENDCLRDGDKTDYSKDLDFLTCLKTSSPRGAGPTVSHPYPTHPILGGGKRRIHPWFRLGGSIYVVCCAAVKTFGTDENKKAPTSYVGYGAHFLPVNERQFVKEDEWNRDVAVIGPGFFRIWPHPLKPKPAELKAAIEEAAKAAGVWTTDHMYGGKYASVEVKAEIVRAEAEANGNRIINAMKRGFVAIGTNVANRIERKV